MRYSIRQLIVAITIGSVLIFAVTAIYRDFARPTHREILRSGLRNTFWSCHEQLFQNGELTQLLVGEPAEIQIPEANRWLIASVGSPLRTTTKAGNGLEVQVILSAALFLNERVPRFTPPWTYADFGANAIVLDEESADQVIEIGNGSRSWSMVVKRLKRTTPSANTRSREDITMCTCWWTESGWSSLSPKCNNDTACLLIRVDLVARGDTKEIGNEVVSDVIVPTATTILACYEVLARGLTQQLEDIQ